MISIQLIDSAKRTYDVDGELWQYDYGQTLKILDLALTKTVVEIDFSTHASNDKSYSVVAAVDSDGIIEVSIPDEVLNLRLARDYSIYIFVYEIDSDSTSGETTYKFQIPVKARPWRKEYDESESQDLSDALANVVSVLEGYVSTAASASAEAQEAAAEIKETEAQVEQNKSDIESLTTTVDSIKQQVEQILEGLANLTES